MYTGRLLWRGGGVGEKKKKKKTWKRRRRIRGGPIGLELIAITPVPPSRRAPRTYSPLWESVLNATMNLRYSEPIPCDSFALSTDVY